VKSFLGAGILGNQPADETLEMALLRARELAEELGEVVMLFFIDMAILEARQKSSERIKTHTTSR
jgi:hypothetical protein